MFVKKNVKFFFQKKLSNLKERQVTPKHQSLDANQSRFLEAPLVQQADSKLKNNQILSIQIALDYYLLKPLHF